MRNKYRRLFQDDNGDNDFWPSFTDMLTTILLVVLLIFIAIVQDQHSDMVEAEAQAKEQKREIEKERKENEKYRETINNIMGVKQDIIRELYAEFGKSNLKIEIDQKTGAIKFEDNLLFETNKSIIAPEFKVQLQEFIPKYMEILFSDHKDEIAEIMIEGHTDDVGSFNYNLDLSQDRAFSVVQYMLSEEFGEFPYRDEVEKKITANGRSYSEPKFIEGSNEIDRNKSRRVEFKFRLTTETEIEEMIKNLESSLEAK